MKRRTIVLILSVFILLTSCIPIRIAPKIQDHKTIKAKKIKRSLPKRQMFIFEDTKDEYEFYKYINTKFELQEVNVHNDAPFTLEEKQYYFSFYEVDIPNKSINLVPIAADALLERANINSSMENLYSIRKENYYIAIEANSDDEHDCLLNSSPSNKIITTYLKELKDEYFSTHNYNEVLFKK
ncbi:hypothetical protein [uncultured Maribacter sp.]|uniref:hypothetical protein n=1 Tax=uncultured Maribacter sp. TaxID=431308 RepID=UPI0030D76362|tara:strand:+ start:1424 stop:1972 length:549 start_codon:yes stop_codon:yes gene_type:complete